MRRLRLSKSAEEIVNGKSKITDVAFQFGFNSVDGYQRAFYKEFGCNPKEFSKN
ncbi:MAG: helix-turn-helix domain-containing protein [Christensenellales bacterium]